MNLELRKINRKSSNRSTQRGTSPDQFSGVSDIKMARKKNKSSKGQAVLLAQPKAHSGIWKPYEIWFGKPPKFGTRGSRPEKRADPSRKNKARYLSPPSYCRYARAQRWRRLISYVSRSTFSCPVLRGSMKRRSVGCSLDGGLHWVLL